MRLALLIVMAATITAVITAQPEDPQAQAVFEVAAIKQNLSGESLSGLRRLPGGRFEATNIQLSGLISFAYQLQPFELVGGPEWLQNDRWDVVAKIDGDPPPVLAPGQIDVMMVATRGLLADRFKLSIRRDTREIPVYQLVLAKRDGTLGKGMRRSTVDCLAIRRAADEAAKGGPPAPNPNTPGRVSCGLMITIGRIQLGGRPLSDLTNALTAMTQRRVVDRTGLTGEWEIDISFTPPSISPGTDGLPPDLGMASLFTAIQEELGLKLEATRLPTSVMVVDHVERPVEG